MSIIELYPTKSASQRTQFSGVKLKMFISYQRLKTLKHLSRLALFCSDFSFYEHFNPFEGERFIYGPPTLKRRYFLCGLLLLLHEIQVKGQLFDKG